ncbi:MAG TPA: PAS domain S-box protein, partial [Dehalococcoidia bacterium]|nr:PAS domain S-box protein [Dehalococcoidia bacterium]
KERERKEYEARYRAIAEDTPLMICRFGAGGALTYVNRAYCDYVNHTPEELTGTSFLLFLPPTDREVIIADIEALTPQSPTLSHEQSDIGLTGELRWQRWTTHALFTEGKATSYQSIGEDITEHKTIEEENDRLDRHIQRLNKLEIIGTLAGGIAHDFNNILSPILGYTDLALLRVAAPDPVHKHLTQISNAAYRAVDLVKQILLFGRQVDQEKQPVAVQQIIQEAMGLLRPSIPRTVEIQLQIDSSCGKVYADATQIHQVIVNLCTNAWQAMEQAGGVLSIELKQVDLDYTQTAIYPGLTHTQLIRLTITDTGIGMDKLTLNQIFEPFFTTKPVDKGTGMGLSVVHGIVHSHDGIIVANSEPGKGAEFKVYLPVDQKTVEARKIVTEKMAKGDESILIVDDEEMLTDMMQEILTSHGYKVDAYNNSLEALDAYKRNPDNFDLIISDLTMPNLAGTELLKEVHKFSPGFPTILMTG